MLEVVAFPLDTNDVVTSLETVERVIKERERDHAGDPEFRPKTTGITQIGVIRPT